MSTLDVYMSHILSNLLKNIKFPHFACCEDIEFLLLEYAKFTVVQEYQMGSIIYEHSNET